MWKQIKSPLFLLSLAVLIQGAVTFIYSLTRHYTFKTSAYDIGDFVQAFHNWSIGNGLMVTIAPPHVAQHWLGVHFSPILYGIAPLYALFPHAELLLFLHSFFIALAAIPLFFAIQRFTGATSTALLLAMLYLINPFTVNAAVWDFHEIAFAPFLIACALWAFAAKNRLALIIICALLIMVKEHYGIAVFGLGLLWALHYRERAFGLSLALSGLIIFALIVGIIMPHLSATSQHLMFGEGQPLDRFGWLLDPARAKTLLLSLAFADIIYVISLLIGWFMLPIASPLLLLPGLADLAVNSLATVSMMRHPFAYHNAALMPVLAFATAHTLHTRFKPPSKTSPKDAKIALALFSMGFAWALLALPGTSINPWEFSAPHLKPSPADRAAMSDIRALIPSDAPIAVQNNVGAHFGDRAFVQHFPESTEGVEWVLLRLDYPYYARANVFGSPFSVDAEEYFQGVDEVLKNPSWKVAYWKENWLVLQKKEGTAQLVDASIINQLHHLKKQQAEAAAREPHF